MKQFASVFSFEFRSLFKSKAFYITVIILSLLCFALPFIPRLVQLFSSNETANETAAEASQSKEKLTYYWESNFPEQDKVKDYLPLANAIQINSLAELKEGIVTGKYKYALHLISPKEIAFYASSDMDSKRSQLTSQVESSLKTYLRDQSLSAQGIDPEVVNKATEQEIKLRSETLGKSNYGSFIMAYIGMFIIYMMVLLCGQIVATAVAKEKSERTMELLITSAKTRNLIVGKVLGVGTCGVLAILALSISTFIAVLLNQSFIPAGLLALLKEAVNPDRLLVFIIFGLAGYILYLFIYAALGALVSKVEDVNSVVSLLTLLFVAAYIVTTYGINVPDSFLLRVASLFPLSSLMSMFVRYSLTNVPLLELALALGLQLVTTCFLAFISIRIYRLGTLSYGKKLGLGQALKSVFSKEH